MKAKKVFVAATFTGLLVLSAVVASADEDEPGLVLKSPRTASPGATSRLVAVEASCPAFSWSVVPEATGYELVVYRVGTDDELRPQLRRRLPAGVSSWTPDLAKCLRRGSAYAWTVRALLGDRASDWSTARLFAVAAERDSGVGLAGEAERKGRREESPTAESVSESSARDEGVESSPAAATVTRAASLGVEIGTSSITIDGDPVVTSATDQDTLGGISCPEGQLLVQGATSWVCLAQTPPVICGASDFLYCYSGSAATLDVGACRAGTRACNAGGTGYDACTGEVLPGTEICDGLDNNCDGVVDEGFGPISSWYPDTDSDGFGDEVASAVLACSAPANHVEDDTDCDDSKDDVFPGAIEWCDSIDNDCDAATDESCVSSVGVAIELTWATPGDPDETDTGPGAGADLDLHFRNAAPWLQAPNDCYWANPNPNWGAFDPSVPDNPQLVLDDTDGAGPELLDIEAPDGPATYRVGVHYADDRGFGSSSATIQIFVDQVLVYENTAALAMTDYFWEVADISWPGGAVTDIDSVTSSVP